MKPGLENPVPKKSRDPTSLTRSSIASPVFIKDSAIDAAKLADSKIVRIGTPGSSFAPLPITHLFVGEL